MSIVGSEVHRAPALARGRALAVLEIAFVVLCCLIAEWAILPFFGKNMLVGLVPVSSAFIFMFFSHRARRETARDLGWRLDNFLQAVRLLVPPMLLASLLLITFGWFTRSISIIKYNIGWPVLWVFVWLYLWGLMQQYALQAFIHRRAQIAWGQGARSIVVVALIFGMLHLPNLWLALATSLGGLLWASIYRRVPNLFALALSHSVMTVVLVSTVPGDVIHGMRVGFNYYF